MRHQRHLFVVLFVLFALCLLPSGAAAQDRYSRSFLVGFMAGLGGSSDAEPDPGFDNFSWQALFAMELEKGVSWGARLGQVGLDPGAGEAFDGDLTYLTVSGEYTAQASFYESGIYLGLGAYDLDGGSALGSDTALGVNLGVTARFRLNERFALLLELSGHYADLDSMQFFAMAHVGVGYRF